MNTLEKKIVKTALVGLKGIENHSPEVSESISWLKALLSNDTVEKLKESASFEPQGCESVAEFLKSSKIYASEKKCSSGKKLLKLRATSKVMHANYKLYCVKNSLFAMGAKQFKDFLVSNGFKYRSAIRVKYYTTSGYEFFVEEGTVFNNSIEMEDNA